MDCRICHNGSGNESFDVAEMMFGTRDRFRYFRCAVCGCLQIDAYPDDLAKYYGSAYYSYNQALCEPGWFERTKTTLRDRYAIGGLGLVGRHLYNKAPNKMLANLASVLRDRRSRILDVGCGSAALLKSLDRIGFHDVAGADPFIEAEIDFGRRGRVHKKTLAQMDGMFDVIMFHHSFEHLPHQQDMLDQVAGKLSPGGTCVMGVPLSSSFAFAQYGVDWVQLDAPRHLYLHSVDSIRRLADSANLTIVRTIFDSTAFQFWGSEQYRQGIPLFDDRSLTRCTVDESMFSREQMAGYARKAAELNDSRQGDQALFFLQRRP